MRALALLLALPLFTVTPTVAQQRGQANLVLTVYAGVANGHRLWSIDRQTLSSVGGNPDTVRLARRLSPALMLGGVFQFFPRGAIGGSVDFGYRLVNLDDACAPVAPFQPDAAINESLCQNITAQSHPGSMITLGVTGIVRIAPAGVVSPYLRAGGNLSFTSVGTVALDAPDTSTVARTVILDNSPRRTSLGLLAASGVTIRAGAAYQLRLEIRDDMTSFERVDGPADGIGAAPTRVSPFHSFGLLLGLDVLLEQKRSRRY